MSRDQPSPQPALTPSNALSSGGLTSLAADGRASVGAHYVRALFGSPAAEAWALGLFLRSMQFEVVVMRFYLALTGALVAAIGCSTPTEVISGVSLTVDSLAVSADGRILTYRYAVTNVGPDSVWAQACGGVIQPSVAVLRGGQQVDRYEGGICQFLSGLVAIAPGGQYANYGSVPLSLGDRFQPYLMVGTHRSGEGRAREVRGPEFGSP
jgi:hypothetical protein